MTTNQNPPAFPCDWKDFQPTTGEQVVREQFSGMDLRDYFAAKAMNGMLPNYRVSGARSDMHVEHQCEYVARYAYGVADAMLAERAKVKP